MRVVSGGARVGGTIVEVPNIVVAVETICVGLGSGEIFAVGLGIVVLVGEFVGKTNK